MGMKWDRWQTKSRKGAYPLFGFLFSVFQFICKGIFIILELVVYGIHISCRAFYPVKHKVAVPHEVDGAVSVLFQLWVGTEF